MKINQSRIQTAAKRRYLEYIKLFPQLKQPKVKTYTTIILSLFAMTFFGVFAINPTITTVIELRKKLEDAEFVNTQLETKLENMSRLREEYLAISDDLPVIFAAIPEKPTATQLFAQIQGVAENSGATITALQSLQVEQASQSKTPPRDSAFSFTVEVQGTYEEISDFLESFVNSERSVTLETVAITKHEEIPNTLIMSIRARAHFRNAAL